MQLTIAIPTYNRNDLLQETLERLVPQLRDGCRILIVDNCSDVPVSETLGSYLANIPEVDCKIVRNTTNIGGAANILRCFELCETEWIWVLGDDDDADEDAIATLSRHVEAHPECVFFNFCSPSHSRQSSFVTNGLNEFVEKFDSFGNVLFTSACIFRLAAFLPQLKFGYYYSYSMAPQVAILLMALGDDGVCCFSDARLVADYMRAPITDYWPPTTALVGRMTLLDLPIPAECKRTLGRKIRSKPGLEYIVSNLTISALKGSPEKALYLFDHICYRQYYYDAGFSLKLRVRLYRSLVKHPRLGYRLLSVVFATLRKFAGYKGTMLDDILVGEQLHRL